MPFCPFRAPALRAPLLAHAHARPPARGAAALLPAAAVAPVRTQRRGRLVRACACAVSCRARPCQSRRGGEGGGWRGGARASRARARRRRRRVAEKCDAEEFTPIAAWTEYCHYKDAVAKCDAGEFAPIAAWTEYCHYTKKTPRAERRRAADAAPFVAGGDRRRSVARCERAPRALLTFGVVVSRSIGNASHGHNKSEGDETRAVQMSLTRCEMRRGAPPARSDDVGR